MLVDGFAICNPKKIFSQLGSETIMQISAIVLYGKNGKKEYFLSVKVHSTLLQVNQKPVSL